MYAYRYSISISRTSVYLGRNTCSVKSASTIYSPLYSISRDVIEASCRETNSVSVAGRSLVGQPHRQHCHERYADAYRQALATIENRGCYRGCSWFGRGFTLATRTDGKEKRLKGVSVTERSLVPTASMGVDGWQHCDRPSIHLVGRTTIIYIC